MKKLYSFYRIYDGEENYIGVTCQPINSRMSRHYFRAENEMNQSKFYKGFRKFSKNWDYEVFDRETLTEEDARNKELMYIQFLKPSLNTIHAS